MSQAELGSLIGITPNTVAKALDTTSNYILGETNNPSSLGYMLLTGTEDTGSEKRLIIRNDDMYINLPESPDEFDILRRVLDLIAKKVAGQDSETVAE